MARQDTFIHHLIPQLSDLELHFLISLIADNHCIVRAAKDDLKDVQRDIEAISHTLFGFSCTVVDCHAKTTLEDISNAAIDDDDPRGRDDGVDKGASSVPFRSSRAGSPALSNTLDERRTCNIVIARNLDKTERNVQIQALELMRSRRIYSRTAVHATPKRFLFIALLEDSIPGPPFLTPHLNDQFFVFQQYTSSTTVEQGFSLAKKASRTPSASSLSSGNSLVRRPSPYKRPSFTPSLGYRSLDPRITDANLAYLIDLVSKVRPSSAISRHIHNIPSHLRLHRHVAGGVSAISTRHLNLLSKILAVLQLPPNDDRAVPVITPTLVSLAATKVYAHRIELVMKPEDERSMQWGSDYEAVAQSLKSASVERCIEETVVGLEVPA